MVSMDSHQRAKAEGQLHILELIEAALDRRSEVFEIVASSEDDDEAQERIRVLFAVSDPHISRAVLDMQVSRWTRSGRKEIADRVEEFRRLLND